MDEEVQAATRGPINTVQFYPSGLVRIYIGRVTWEEWRHVDGSWTMVDRSDK